MKKSELFSAKKLTYFAILTALVIVLQVFGGSIKIGTVSLNFTLIPVVLCGMLLGVVYATAIGFIVGAVTLIMVVTGVDGWSLVLFNSQPVMIVLVCIVKSTLAGLVSSLTYKLFKNKVVGSFISSAIAPIVNTGVFVIGMIIIKDTLIESFSIGGSFYYYLFILVCGVNFLVEFGLNMILAPTINKIVTLIDKGIE